VIEFLPDGRVQLDFAHFHDTEPVQKG